MHTLTIWQFKGQIEQESFPEIERLARELMCDGYDVLIDGQYYEVKNWDSSPVEIGPCGTPVICQHGI